MDEPDVPVEPVELKELRSQLAGLEQLGYNRVIEDAKRKLQLQIENLSHQLHGEAVVDSGNRELLKQVAGTIDFWHQLEPDQQRRFYRALVSRVVVQDGQVKEVLLKV